MTRFTLSVSVVLVLASHRGGMRKLRPKGASAVSARRES